MTLDPNHLDSSCYIDLTGVGHTHVWSNLAADDARPCVILKLFFTSSPPPTAAHTYKHRPFPPGTCGFL
ncbi:hypothetical protein EWM64_g5853 [Hericium alpestre]|uniref:Uncharacterized protein n=1 Tax=Hericium alpestre TaxID=135208 RepID=A0A4Y9ZTM9_9AGAM|nr:hypothetical protein EWM64_g5853 [Hericium alpestre]